MLESDNFYARHNTWFSSLIFPVNLPVLTITFEFSIICYYLQKLRDALQERKVTTLASIRNKELALTS
jgi:hypothetical protein